MLRSWLLRITQENPGRLGRDLLLGVALGLIGYGVNRMPLSVGWGVELHVGSFFPFLLMPRSVAGAMVGGMIAPAHLLLVWHHPFAWLVTAVEIPAIALLTRRRGFDLVSADAIYWAAIGLPAGFLGYHFLSDFLVVPAVLAALQQGLGSFFSISLACVAAMLVQLGRNQPSKNPPIPLRAVVSAFVSVVTISTGILILGVDARLYWQTLVEDRVAGVARVRDQADAALDRLRDDVALVVQAMVSAAPDDGPLPEVAAEARRVLSGIEVRDESGTEIWRWTGQRSPTAMAVTTISVPVERAGRRATAVATLEPSAIAERLDGLGVRGAAVVLRDGGGIVHADPSGVTSRLVALDWHCLPLQPDGSLGAETPDLRPMVAPLLAWASPMFCAETTSDVFPGLRLTATMAVTDVIRRHHRAVLDTMLLVVGIGGAGVLTAGLLSAATTRRIELMRDALSAGPGFRFAPRTESGIAEIRLLEQDIGRLSQALEREAEEANLMRRRMETIAAHTPIVVYILDLSSGNATPSFVTQSIEPILGYAPAGTLTPEWWTACLHPEDAPRVRTGLERIAETGGFTGEFRLRDPANDGAYRWVYQELRVIEGPDGRPREAVGVMIDITQRKHSETRLIETANLVALGEMSAAVAHELTQPLHVIGLAAENLMDQVATTAVVSERALIKLHDIVEQTHRAAGIVHRMRQLGRKDADAPARVRIGDALESALRPLQSELAAFGITLTLGGNGLHCLVLGQPGLLEQVALNLVINARDAIYQRHAENRSSLEGEDRIDVLVTEQSIERRVSIRVRDTGTGLDPAILRRAFEPFFTTKEVGKGLGLGLSICHGTVRDLGGHIEARNWQQGAEFEVFLPLLAKASDKQSA